MYKLKISTLILGLLISNTAFAVQILPIPGEQKISYQESYFQTFLRCWFSIHCYRTPLLGTTLTNITGATLISTYPSIQNANNTALNDGKMETSTTSVASITTLSNLVSVGTLTSGSLGSGFTTVVVASGGTGLTTLTSGDIIYGNSSISFARIASSTGGTILQTNFLTGAPQWVATSTLGLGNFGISFNVASSSIALSTTTRETQYQAPIPLTLIRVSCSSSSGTSTIQLDSRSASTPNTAGTNILFAGGLLCGSGTNQTASTTFATTAIPALNYINLQILDAAPSGPAANNLSVHIQGTK